MSELPDSASRKRRYGMDAAAIERLTAHWHKHNKGRTEDGACDICNNDFCQGQKMRTLPCGHHFHADCCDAKLQRSRCCPTCKKDVLTTRRSRRAFLGLHAGRRHRIYQKFTSEVETLRWRLRWNNSAPPKALTDKEVGVTVRRGADWKWGSQDGGAYGRGIGITIPGCDQDGWIRVQWKNGKKNNYRCGGDGCYDLQLVD